ncbi:FAD-dependent oxidoreductase [Lacihabitans sp. LS3-19]|uniref:NAD(P)/FAD-dependent oxidoreductase n=1 Tax=Lacihabitans sp. LS3-19 TaxID=2487335 RepID=UPI0020CC9A02|nr:FAD-dependent oxidoreductase [Lacihabitans sp. LS3-19]MCP9766922.1 FAD-dependent oxidoreductase [Lacihabitans sp. LS3-19]
MSQKPHVIVGGGIIGLFTAFYLLETGREIVIIEKSDGEEGCSFGNAGMVVPSHFIPLASPGMIEKGLKWMLDSESPFYVKPRLSLDLIKWGLSFYKNANQKHVDKSIPYLRDLGLLSKSLYHELAEELKYSYEEKGLVMYCKKAETFEEESQVADLANKIGLKAEILDTKELHELEPNIKPDVAGGIYFPGDAHLNPSELVKNLKVYLLNKGVEIKYNSEVIDFYGNNNKIESIKIKSSGKVELLEPETLTIAAGSWSGVLAKKLRFNLPMQAGKGYSISKSQLAGKEIFIPNILVEARVAITPMSGSFVRFGGTMEIGGLDDTINMNRVRGIVKSIPDFFPEYDLPMPNQEEVWHGFRPCSPDGLPYIGVSGIFKNLFINAGHAMMGISLAPGSGKLMSQIITKEKPEMALEGFLPERFGI